MTPSGELETSYVLDTRPILNFILSGNPDLLAAVLGDHVFVTRSVLEQTRASMRAIRSSSYRRLASGENEAADVIAFSESWERSLTSIGVMTADMTISEQRLAERLRAEWHAIDAGESDVFAICLQRGAVAVIDDAPAYRVACECDISAMGTVQVLMRGVDFGVVAEVDADVILGSMRAIPWERAPRYGISQAREGTVEIWPA